MIYSYKEFFIRTVLFLLALYIIDEIEYKLKWKNIREASQKEFDRLFDELANI